MEKVIGGIGGAALIIGLALIGLCVGASLNSGIAVQDHSLFGPALACLGAGVLVVLILMLIGDQSDGKQTPDS